MKILDLKAEKVKIEKELRQNDYSPIHCIFGDTTVKDVETRASHVKQKYAEDQRLLTKLDAINNALHESDATTYIDVHGCRLSVATAREYLGEFKVDKRTWDEDDITEADDCYDFSLNTKKNLHMCVLGKCRDFSNIISMQTATRIIQDPLNLKDRTKEFEEKQMDWYLDIKKAIIVSDTVTEAVLVY